MKFIRISDFMFFIHEEEQQKNRYRRCTVQ